MKKQTVKAQAIDINSPEFSQKFNTFVQEVYNDAYKEGQNTRSWGKTLFITAFWLSRWFLMGFIGCIGFILALRLL